MLGAVVAPTDAVAAVATFARVRVPERVRRLVEGESLINDATGLTALQRRARRGGRRRVLARSTRCSSSCSRRSAARVIGVAVGWVVLRAIRQVSPT